VKLNVGDWERAAAEAVDPNVWCYFEGGADTEWTLGENRRAFARWRFRPRVLVDVAEVTAATTLLGAPVSMPFVVGPIAYQSLLHPEGERAVARACAATGTVMCVSTFTSFTHTELAEAAPTLVQWCQLYVFKDDARTFAHLDDAVDAGCAAVVLTADTPVLGRRERDLRLGFVVPDALPLPYARHSLRPGDANPLAQQGLLASSVTWRDIERYSSHTRLPVLVKGIVTREDAVLAVEHGAAAIVVSNHGGRQLDGAPAALDALPEVVEAVDGRIPVLLDGGVRHGLDILKALALGAAGVIGGRAPIYGLAAGGEDGVRAVLELLRDELGRGLALLGCTRPDDVTRSHVAPTSL
jgi:4-hydroxymandelate oxidase